MTISYVAKIYYKHVKAGEMTIEQVPELWREQVKEMLKADK